MPNPNKWEDNSIQFPRLLSEIMAVGMDETQWDGLLISMDLESDELSEIFERAQQEWEKVKEKECPIVGAPPTCVMCGTPTTRNHPSETCTLKCQVLCAEFNLRAGIKRTW